MGSKSSGPTFLGVWFSLITYFLQTWSCFSNLTPFNVHAKFLWTLVISIQFGMEVSFTTWLHNHQNDLISLIFAWVPPFPNMSKVIQSPLISVPFRSFPFPFMPPKRKVSPKKQGLLSVLLLKPVIENVFKSIFKSTGSPEGSWQEPSKKMDKGVVN